MQCVYCDDNDIHYSCNAKSISYRRCDINEVCGVIIYCIYNEYFESVYDNIILNPCII